MSVQVPAAEVGADAGALDLVGSWRARLQFRDGDFAAVDDLELMCAFNADGTMTEPSDYDAAPPVPPAYWTWRRVRPDRFEAKYDFCPTSAPAGLEDIITGSGCLPAGRGVFWGTITVAADGATLTSTIRYEAYDEAARPAEGGGDATGRGVRLRFSRRAERVEV
jgi:hypothetical protein